MKITIARARNGGVRLWAVLCFIGTAFGQPPTRLPFAPVVSKVEPVYPVTARTKGIEGAVRLDVLIGKDGRVLRVESISGDPALRDAAKNAVLKWVYRPTLLNGEPIEIITEVCVPFVRSKRVSSPYGTRRRVRS